LVGVPSGSTALAFDFFSLFNATVRGCVAGFANSDIFLPLLVKLNRQGRFPFEKLSPRVYRFEEINEALADMHREAVIKPLLSF
jgi:aryl-alcohol dehydrogenase